MAHLPILKPREIERIVEKQGFVFVRQTGSHRIFQRSDGKWTMVPMHCKTLGKGLLNKIIKDIGLNAQSLQKK